MIFDVIKQQVDIVAEIGKTVQLKKEGRLYRGLCVFHSEKTPSLIVYPDSWYCFGCQAGGSIIDWVMKQKNCSAIEAAQSICHDHDIQFTVQDQEKFKATEETRKKKKEIFDTLLPTLEEKPEAKDYLTKKRGLSEDTIKEFGLGYGANGNCVVIPIKDKFGRPIAFAQRFLTAGPNGEKYKNDSTDDIYQKKTILFNFDNARKYLKDNNIIYVNEGYFDVMTFWECGIKTAVAYCGSSISREQVLELKSIINDDTTIVLVPNNDSVGQGNLQFNKNMIKMNCPGTHIRVLVIPKEYEEKQCKDLNDYLIVRGGEAGHVKVLFDETIAIDMFLAMQMIDEEPVREKQYLKARKLVSEAENDAIVDDIGDFLSKTWGKEKSVVMPFLIGKKETDVSISRLKSVDDLMDDYIQMCREGHRNKIYTGYAKIDEMTRGICPGEVMTWMAASGVGKTALALNIIRNVGEKQNVPTLFFSLEQPGPQVFERLVTISSGESLTGRKVEESFIGEEADPEIMDTLKRMTSQLSKVIVVDENSLTLQQIEEYVRQAGLLIFGEPVKLIVIDYLGYIEGKGDNAYQIISKIAKDLKGLAKKLNCAVLVLHQLNKTGGSGGDEVEGMQARDSGVTIESADYILGAWRPCLKVGISADDAFRKRNEFFVKIIKNRKGPIKDVLEYQFIPETLKIWDTAPSMMPNAINKRFV